MNITVFIFVFYKKWKVKSFLPASFAINFDKLKSYSIFSLNEDRQKPDKRNHVLLFRLLWRLSLPLGVAYIDAQGSLKIMSFWQGSLFHNWYQNHIINDFWDSIMTVYLWNKVIRADNGSACNFYFATN